MLKCLPQLNKLSKIVLWDLNNLIAIDKPINTLSHPNKKSSGVKSYKETLLINGPYIEKKEMYTVKALDASTLQIWLINRLDSATSGIILASTNEVVANAVKRLFKHRMVQKKYYALVFGNVGMSYKSVNDIIWSNNMGVSKGISYVRAVEPKGNYIDNTKHAITKVQTISYDSIRDTTLLELTPLTGFTHQLRFQCAQQGFPIVGDKVYGDFARNKQFVEQMNKSVPKSVNPADLNGTPNCSSGFTKASYKRLFLHSHSIELSYSLPSSKSLNGVSSKEVECHFNAVSPLPQEFIFDNIV